MNLDQNFAQKQVPLTGKSKLENADHETVSDALALSPLCLTNLA